jgi:hypothetical protein
MHSGSKFWSTLPIAKKNLKEEGIVSKEKPFELSHEDIKIEDTVFDIKVNEEITKDVMYFVLENGISSSGNSFVIDPKMKYDNVNVKLADKDNNILGFCLSIPCTLFIQGKNGNETIESGMTTHLCVSSSHRNKELAKYVISGVIDHGFKINVFTGYHYISIPKSSSNIKIFNYYRPLNIESAIQFGYEVPLNKNNSSYSLDSLPSSRQLRNLEIEYGVKNYPNCKIIPSDFDDLRFFQSQNRKASIIFSALRFQQLKQQFEFLTIRKNDDIIGVVVYRTLIMHVGKIGKGCGTAQIALLEMDNENREIVLSMLIKHLKEKKYVVMCGVTYGELNDEKLRKKYGIIVSGIQYLDFYNLNIETKKDSSNVNLLYY